MRNPISAIELNAEMLQESIRSGDPHDLEEAAGLVTAIRDQVNALDQLTEEYLAFARFPRPQFEDESINHLIQELAEFVRPLAARQGQSVRVEADPAVPMLEIDRRAGGKNGSHDRRLKPCPYQHLRGGMPGALHVVVKGIGDAAQALRADARQQAKANPVNGVVGPMAAGDGGTEDAGGIHRRAGERSVKDDVQSDGQANG